MTNERKQSALSKARSFKHSKLKELFCNQFIANEHAGKTSLFHMRGVDATHLRVPTDLSESLPSYAVITDLDIRGGHAV